MATLLTNRSGGPILLQGYGGALVANGAGVILADTVANVAASIRGLASAVELRIVPDGQTGAISPGGGGTGSVIRVPYTATGSEGTDITVPIGRTMANAAYGVSSAERGNSGGGPVTEVVIADLPQSTRTTTTFEVVFSGQPASGDQFEFFIYI